MFNSGREEVDHFELLENYILQYQTQGKIFISGDFNCRCGSESNDILRLNTYIDDSDLFIDLPFGQCKDRVIDMRGRYLLSLCQDCMFTLSVIISKVINGSTGNNNNNNNKKDPPPPAKKQQQKTSTAHLSITRKLLI